MASLETRTSQLPCSPEMELLICTARSVLGPRERARVESLIEDGVTWGSIHRLAQTHGTAPLLYHHLSSFPEKVPSEFLERLCLEYDWNLKRNMARTAQLLEVMRLLDDVDIPAIPLKGPTLAAFAYGNLALRVFGDLDILIPNEALQPAASRLKSAGYEATPKLTPLQERWFIGHFGHLSLSRGADSLVELHVYSRSRRQWFPFSFDRLQSRVAQIRVAGQPLPILSPADLMLHLSVHGTKHIWSTLGWIADVAEAAAKLQLDDWNRLFAEGRRLGVQTMVGLALRLADIIFAIGVPPEFDDTISANQRIARLAAWVSSTLLAEPSLTLSRTERIRFQRTACDQLSDKIRVSVRPILVPTPADWAAVKLPKTLDFLYPIVRPIRLILGKNTGDS